MREIPRQASANLAAVNYHFGSKEGMVAAMLDRRLKPLNTKRLELLETELQRSAQEGRQPDVEMLLRALVEPMLRFFKTGEGGAVVMKIFGQIHSDSDGTIRKHFLKHMAPVFQLFFEGFHQALPEIPPDRLTSRIIFCIGAMAHCADIMVDQRIAAVSSELEIPILFDPEELIEELIQFIIRGMKKS
jgi:AcrR family transcriptional regulator